MKKIIGTVIMLIVVSGFFSSFAMNNVNAKENRLMTKYETFEEAKKGVENEVISQDYQYKVGDFYGNYVKDEYFIISKDDFYYSSQAYYMSVAKTGEIAFCLEPEKTAGSIQSNRLDLGKFATLNKSTQNNIHEILETAIGNYTKSKDVNDLIAGQLAIWKEAGAKIEFATEDITKSIENLENDLLLSEVTGEALIPIEQDITEGQDLVTQSTEQESSFSAVQTLTEDGNGIPQKEEELEYKLEITNNSEQNINLSVQQKEYSEFFTTDEVEINVQNNEQDEQYLFQDLIDGNVAVTELKPDQTATMIYAVSLNDEVLPTSAIVNTIDVCLDAVCKQTTTQLNGLETGINKDLLPVASIEEVESNNVEAITKITNEEEIVEIPNEVTFDISLVDEQNILENAELNIYDESQNIVQSEKLDIPYNDTITISDLQEGNYVAKIDGSIKFDGKEYNHTLIDDSTPANLAQVDFTIENDGEVIIPPTGGEININGTVDELTDSSLKLTLQGENETDKIITSGKIILSSETDEVVYDFSEEELENLFTSSITIEVGELIENTQYTIKYEFYNDDTLIGNGIKENFITTDALVPTLNISQITIQDTCIVPTINYTNPQAITNSGEIIKINIIDSEGNILIAQEENLSNTYSICDTEGKLIQGETYTLEISTVYNVDNSYDVDQNEGNISQSQGFVYGDEQIVGDLRADYSQDYVFTSDSVSIDFTLSDPEEILDKPITLKVEVYKVEDGNYTNINQDNLTYVGDAAVTENSGTYNAYISGLEENTTYLFMTKGVSNASEIAINSYNNFAITDLTPEICNAPVMTFEITPSENSFEANGLLEDECDVVDRKSLPSISVVENETNLPITPAMVTEKPFSSQYNISASTILQKSTEYRLESEVKYNEANGNKTHEIEDINNIFTTTNNNETTPTITYSSIPTIKTDGIETTFNLTDPYGKITSASILTIQVYTDENYDGIVNGEDLLIEDANIETNSSNQGVYDLSISGLEENTQYQLYAQVDYDNTGQNIEDLIQVNQNFTTTSAEIIEEYNYQLLVNPVEVTEEEANFEISLLEKDSDYSNISKVEISLINEGNASNLYKRELTGTQLESLPGPINLTYSGLLNSSTYNIKYSIYDLGGTLVEENLSTTQILTDFVQPEVIYSNPLSTTESLSFNLDISDYKAIKNSNTQMIDIKLVDSNGAVMLDTEGDPLIEKINTNNSIVSSPIEFDNLVANTIYYPRVEFSYNVDNYDNTDEMFLKTYEPIQTLELTTEGVGISTCKELEEINNAPEEDYYLKNDIDCKISNPSNEDYDQNLFPNGFIPIDIFSGELEGNGFSIKSLYIDDSQNLATNIGVGMIRENQGNINNLNLTSADVNGTWSTGALTGKNFGEINNITTSGKVVGQGLYIGGIVGINEGNIDNVVNECSVTGMDYIGGIAGVNNGSITNSSSTGSITTDGLNQGDIFGGENIVINSSLVTDEETAPASNENTQEVEKDTQKNIDESTQTIDETKETTDENTQQTEEGISLFDFFK